MTMMTLAASFGVLNWAVLIAYLFAMLLIGVYCSFRNKNTSDFFLAGQRIPWWAAGLAIYGTQLSAITFMAIPATAYQENWVRLVGNWTILAVAPLVVACYLPFFRRLNVATAYAYLERRFNSTVRLTSSALFILFQFGRIGIVLYLPAIALEAVTGISVYTCILLMGLLTTAYTVIGGMEAVIWTDVVQVVILLIGALVAVAVAVSGAGGMGPLVQHAMEADKFRLANWGWDSSQMVLWVVVVGFFFFNLIPYTTDQAVIQRYLTTRDERQAARSIWTNVALMIPTGVIFFFMGTAIWGFYQASPELALPQRADQIVPWFVVSQLPAGVAGLLIAGIFAAAMSTLSGSMNSVVTAYIVDFHRRWSSASDRSDLRLARWLTLGLGATGVAAASIIASVNVSFVFDAFNTVLGWFGGSLAGLFVLGIFTRRATSAGALTGLIAGGLATVAATWSSHVHPFLYGGVGAVACIGVGYLASLAMPKPYRDVTGLTIYTLQPRTKPSSAPQVIVTSAAHN